MTEALAIPRLADETTYGVLSPYRVDPFVLLSIEFPEWNQDHVIDFAGMVHDLERFTGWKDRSIAKVIGTTHPTVRAIRRRESAVGSRTPSILKRLRDAHMVISRIHEIAGKNAQATAMALDSAGDGHSATWYLKEDQPEQAYLVAMEALRPRQSSGLLIGSRPAPHDGRRVAYRDEE